MEINRNNYEAFLLDLFEGRLSDHESRMLEDFLKRNPDCIRSVPDQRGWQDHEAEGVFPEKNSLKKDLPGPESRLTKSNFDLFSIARMEGDLTPGQQKTHEAWIRSDPALEKEWGLWLKTRLVPRLTEFPGKSRLKRRRIPFYRRIAAGAAAAILAAVVLFATREFITPVNHGFTGPEQAETIPHGAGQNGIIQTGEPSPIQPAPVEIFSIGKRPDPPELTGEGKRSESPVREDTLRMENPVAAPIEVSRIAAMEPPGGSYDRIRTLEVAPLSAGDVSLSWARLQETELRKVYRDYLRERNVSVWSVAGAGIRGINLLTGSEMYLDVSRNDSGRVSAVHFRSERLNLDAPLRNRQ